MFLVTGYVLRYGFRTVSTIFIDNLEGDILSSCFCLDMVRSSFGVFPVT